MAAVHGRPVAVGQLDQAAPRPRAAGIGAAGLPARDDRAAVRPEPVRHVAAEGDLRVVVVADLMIGLHERAVQVRIARIAEVGATVEGQVRIVLRVGRQHQRRGRPVPEVVGARQPRGAPAHATHADVGVVAAAVLIVLRGAAAVGAHVADAADRFPADSVRRGPPFDPVPGLGARPGVGAALVLLAAPAVVRLHRVQLLAGVGIEAGAYLADRLEPLLRGPLRVLERGAGGGVGDDVVGPRALPLDLAQLGPAPVVAVSALGVAQVVPAAQAGALVVTAVRVGGVEHLVSGAVPPDAQRHHVAPSFPPVVGGQDRLALERLLDADAHADRRVVQLIAARAVDASIAGVGLRPVDERHPLLGGEVAGDRRRLALRVVRCLLGGHGPDCVGSASNLQGGPHRAVRCRSRPQRLRLPEGWRSPPRTCASSSATGT